MVLVTDFIVLPVGFGLAVRARPASEPVRRHNMSTAHLRVTA